jgi:hypothetical protein
MILDNNPSFYDGVLHIIHACVGPTLSTRADGGALSSDPVSCIYYYLKKTIVVMDLADVNIPVATV